MLDPVSFLMTASKDYQADGLSRYLIEPAGPRGGMSPPQEMFHRSQSRKRAFIAANKSVKSLWGACEAWWHLLPGTHPFRETPPAGTMGWVLCSDLRQGWQTISHVLHEMEPPGVLHPACQYVPGVGYQYRGSKQLMLANRSSLVGKGCEQSLLALESARVGWLWVDEPPKEAHWHAARSRLSMDKGNMWLTCTPVGRPCGWLRNLLEGNNEESIEAEPGWYIEHIELSEENAPHRDPESIRLQREECSPWEFQQRILAKWEGLSKDRWIDGFTEGNIFTDDEQPTNLQALGLGIDWGEQPGKTVIYLIGWDNFSCWVLSELIPKSPGTPASNAREITDMIQAYGISLHDVDECRADSNSAGALGVGFSINDLLMRELAKIAGSSRTPIDVKVPYKRRGSVAARTRLISSACVDGRLRVHESCSRLIHSMRHWRGENSDLKDPLDAMGYMAEVWLSPGNQGPGLMLIG